MNLSELILANKGDRTYDALARDCGGAPTSGRLQQIAARKRPLANFPDPPSIRGLARGLRVTELTVLLAAGRSLDLNVDLALPVLAQRLPAGVDQLDDAEVDAILTMIYVMVSGHGREASVEQTRERLQQEIADAKAAEDAASRRVRNGDETAQR